MAPVEHPKAPSQRRCRWVVVLIRRVGSISLAVGGILQILCRTPLVEMEEQLWAHLHVHSIVCDYSSHRPGGLCCPPIWSLSARPRLKRLFQGLKRFRAEILLACLPTCPMIQALIPQSFLPRRAGARKRRWAWEPGGRLAPCVTLPSGMS